MQFLRLFEWMIVNAQRIVLAPLSWLYGFAIIIRNWCYDKEIFHTIRLGTPVISVGNMTAGGTGKTPFVEYLVAFFLAIGKRVAVVSRGYKRVSKGTFIVSDGKMVFGTAGTGGDEPYQIARKFPSIMVIVDEDRARGAAAAIERFQPDIILLDDGFQHRRLRRGLDIVMIDGTYRLDDIALLPAGYRREPLSSLHRSDLLVVSGCNATMDETKDLFRKYSTAPVILAQLRPKEFRNIALDKIESLAAFKNKRCVAFCGIAQPASFRALLEEIGIEIAELLVFPDHHRYTPDDIRSVEEAFKAKSAHYVLTTEKDAVKFSSAAKSGLKESRLWYYLEIETSIQDGEEHLHHLLNQTMEKAA